MKSNEESGRGGAQKKMPKVEGGQEGPEAEPRNEKARRSNGANSGLEKQGRTKSGLNPTAEGKPGPQEAPSRTPSEA